MSTPTTPASQAELHTLQRQYFALVPPYLLRLPSPRALAHPEAQAWLVAHVLEHTLPSPEAGYRRGFWRRVLGVIEEGVAEGGEDDAVDEAIYEAVADLMALGPSAGAPKPSYKTFIYDLPASEASVTLLEEQVAVQAGTTGLRTWTAALHLAHHVLYSSHILFGASPGPERGNVAEGSHVKRNGGEGVRIPPIVELGAGTGLLSLVLAGLGADVVATDLGDEDEEEVEGEGERRTPLGRLRANIALNTDRTRPPRALALDWADAQRDPRERPGVWADVVRPVDGRRRAVVAADVIYDPTIVPLLVSTIAVLLAPSPRSDSNADSTAEFNADGPSHERDGEAPIAIVAATVRNEETFALFLDTCARQGLRTELLPLAPMDPAAPTFWDTALDAGTRVEVVRISRQ